MSPKMGNEQVKAFALELLHADTESQVIQHLKSKGFWDDSGAWRLLGDHEGNYATIGNQQSKPEAALVEKIINSVDARLMNACLSAGIDPETAAAPTDIPSAVRMFFPGSGGSLQDWAAQTRKAEAQFITLSATGEKRHPCLTLADRGEGQTPQRVPETFMSINRKNKLRIPFVQGKFNMGGTGVLKFCGEKRFQLVITRRNPGILTKVERANPANSCWSITITRRERPTEGVGAVRNSMFTYLAPVEAGKNPRSGSLLTFEADSLPLMPEHNKPYSREIEWGSAVKLYNYDMKGFTSHILMKDGLLYRLEALLPEIALPVNLHECRDYGGKVESSFVTPLAGLIVRLESGKGGNVEAGFPDPVPFQVRGEKMTARIYAFRDGKAETYRTNEGVIFAINGQTHGTLPKTIFSRKSVKLGRLADSLLVTVDCTGIGVDAREDLFMNSRDRLSQHGLRKDVEAEIEEILGKHPRLKQLANERRANDISERLADTKPLEEVLDAIFKSSPSLNALFRTGQRLSNPYNRQSAGSGGGNGTGDGNGNGDGGGPGEKPFLGKPHPTYFRFLRKKDGVMLERDCEYGRRCRMTFETDVVNDYFHRTSYRGRYDVEVVDDGAGEFDGLDVKHNLILYNGLAHWSVELPEEVEVGKTITLQCTVADDLNPGGIVNIAKLSVRPQVDRSGGNGKRNSEGSGGPGPSGDGGTAGIAMPEIKRVKEPEWPEHKFDANSACKIVEETDGSYTFYVNVDNVHLRHELKAGREDVALQEAKFVYGNVLVGLALLHDDRQRGKAAPCQTTDSDGGVNDPEGEPVAERVEKTTRALGPFIIPMINSLGALSAEDVAALGEKGDDE